MLNLINYLYSDPNASLNKYFIKGRSPWKSKAVHFRHKKTLLDSAGINSFTPKLVQKHSPGSVVFVLYAQYVLSVKNFLFLGPLNRIRGWLCLRRIRVIFWYMPLSIVYLLPNEILLE